VLGLCGVGTRKEWAVILVIGGRSKIGLGLIESLRARGKRVRTVTLFAGIATRSMQRASAEWGCWCEARSSGRTSESPAEFVSAHTDCDRHLEQSGLEYVIVRPNLFMQNVPESNIPSIGEDGNLYVDAGDARISMVDTRDVAAVASTVLTEDGHAGAHYDVTGREALSYDDVAMKLSGAMGREIRYVAVPDQTVRDSLLIVRISRGLASAARPQALGAAKVINEVSGGDPGLRSLGD
jgi:nucleoside-diphosphate-sugar epimerase